MSITVQIIGVGVFSDIMQQYKWSLEMPTPADGLLTVSTLLKKLDEMYDGRIFQELYLKDGSPNLWTRVMLNGRDIRFLPEDKLRVHDGDNVLLSSAMAGG